MSDQTQMLVDYSRRLKQEQRTTNDLQRENRQLRAENATLRQYIDEKIKRDVEGEPWER